MDAAGRCNAQRSSPFAAASWACTAPGAAPGSASTAASAASGHAPAICPERVTSRAYSVGGVRGGQWSAWTQRCWRPHLPGQVGRCFSGQASQRGKHIITSFVKRELSNQASADKRAFKERRKAGVYKTPATQKAGHQAYHLRQDATTTLSASLHTACHRVLVLPAEAEAGTSSATSVVVVAGCSIRVPLRRPVLEVVGVLSIASVLHELHVLKEDCMLLLGICEHTLLCMTQQRQRVLATLACFTQANRRGLWLCWSASLHAVTLRQAAIAVQSLGIRGRTLSRFMSPSCSSSSAVLREMREKSSSMPSTTHRTCSPTASTSCVGAASGCEMLYCGQSCNSLALDPRDRRLHCDARCKMRQTSEAESACRLASTVCMATDARHRHQSTILMRTSRPPYLRVVHALAGDVGDVQQAADGAGVVEADEGAEPLQPSHGARHQRPDPGDAARHAWAGVGSHKQQLERR